MSNYKPPTESIQKYILWGSSGHALVLNALIEKLNGKVIALFDNSNDARSVIPNVPLHYGMDGFSKWLHTHEHIEELAGLVAIGGCHGKDRIEIQTNFREHNIKVRPIVHPKAFVCDTAVIASGVQILANSCIASHVRIDEACIINHGAQADHECHIGAGSHLAPGCVLCGCVNVGRCVMIGAGAVVLPRIRIGDNAIIGAGAVVTQDVSSNSVVIGNPARTLR